MSKEKAVAYYADKKNKFNCAQAVIAAFGEKFALDGKIVEQFASCGSGKAPGGECGACYAARFVLGEKHKLKAVECEAIFLSKAGSLKCREIRQLKRLSCAGCVETAAEFLDKV